MSVDKIIDNIIAAEGGYVYHENDRGGPTNWGVTEKVARQNGYYGDMRYYPQEEARKVYRDKYYHKPGFGKVAMISEKVAEELTDTGVNMGPATAAKFLQRSLNALNRKGLDYAELAVDGGIGPATLKALKAYMDKRRSQDGENTLLKCLNILQGERYISICENDHSQEAFLYGWVTHRIKL